MDPGGSTDEGSEDGGPAGPAVADEAPDGHRRMAQEWKRIYAPKSVDGEFEDLQARRRLGKGPMLSSRSGRGRPSTKEEATVPWAEALPAYAEAAERAVKEGAIPPEYRARVRGYFDNLK